MQITINLPDNLTDKIQDKLGDLSKKILNKLAIEAFLEGFIDFDEFRQMLGFQDDIAFKSFLLANLPVHSGGILNLYGACAGIDFPEDDLGIADDMNDDLIGVFDE
ncbi:hypothetical protein MEN41_22360 [Dolichospermum sp. ST_con]|nr:hypothetical protein [Dolichospermum sp. ST_con]MDD1421690.1 hypothetical protein [Dolichospermum sp. ST_sed1]MDD1427195.1 hypothetical protein [Dolichospermum sp. ST_sed9]MDD1431934.1 hypothetical protein [Dolichospermum sp. ST_sed6]MDD1435850.1 hypothetical protein [Dolichospermum sp. ST_sed10]MDD1441356.1 hypothetical protein [Dolichospermum sp. ST_sed3]MDD1448672.1 hypothetical protein [Dolichospermum sp. ST_sed8]MDD1455414.1 hypothetical protein [Dolichospermum sp. ST_sed7]MDD146275